AAARRPAGSAARRPTGSAARRPAGSVAAVEVEVIALRAPHDQRHRGQANQKEAPPVPSAAVHEAGSYTGEKNWDPRKTGSAINGASRREPSPSLQFFR